MKKIVTLLLAVVMLLSVMTVALADGEATLTDGIAGKWTAKDKEIVQAKTINIKKELLSFNKSSTSVYAPAFKYIYTVTPVTDASLTITDDGQTNHESGNDVVAPVNAGITTGLKVSNGTAGTETSAVGELEFTNATVLTTSASGGSNMYDITLDFTNVEFTKPGVYRYKIVESLADSKTYDGIAIKHGGSDTNKVRYLDVYVDGELNIYGYVCMAANGSVTKATEKTNGFVSDSEGQDEYYTYDLTLKKSVENDNYAEDHAFPFTVIFNNTENYSTTFTITETAATGSTGINPAGSSIPSAWKGVAKVKEDADIVYTGIPAGVSVDVYETNDMTGVTYEVTTKLNGVEVEHEGDSSVSWGATPTQVVAQTTKNAYESTKTSVITTKYKTEDAQTLEIINTLLLISPTGVVVRVAPYVMILAAGIALLLIGRRRRHTAKD